MDAIKKTESLNACSKTLVADIGIFFTVPYKAAIDIATQLSEEILNTVKQIINEPVVTKHYDYEVDYWVDVESIGNITAIKAKNLAYFLSTKIHKNSELVVNSNDFNLDDENQLFLEFLLGHLPELTIHFNKIESQNTEDQHSSEAVIQHAWSAVRVGAINLAVRILKRYYEQTKNIIYLLNLQYIRLVSACFHDAAGEPYDELNGPDSIMSSLFYIKAYCGALSNNIQVADTYFKKMGMNVDMKLHDLQSLYHMNIYALCQHRMGNSQIAFELEHKIENELNSKSETYTQIRYINSLNLARLYRFAGNYEQSKKYFDLAYESINGVMLEADHVYMNVNYGQLYQKSGDISKAFACWLRAALHWVSMRYPEALGWRVRKALLKKNVQQNKALDLNEISDVFYKNLTELAAQLNIVFKERDGDFNIIQAKYFDGKFEQARYYGKDNHVGLIAAVSSKTETWCYHQPRELKQLIFKCLTFLHCLPDAKLFNTLVIDTDHDTQMPILFHQAIKRCIFLNIKELNWNGEAFDVSKYKQELLPELMVKLSPSRASWADEKEKDCIVYKRYKKNVSMQSEWPDFFDNLQKIPYIDAIKKYSADFLNNLEKEKIIHFDLTYEG